MYTRDCLKISKWVGDDPDRLRWMMCFVLLSIRTKFYLMYDHMSDLRDNKGLSKHLWGFKGKAYKELYLDPHGNLNEMTEKTDTETLMYNISSFTGYGNAKAGFVAQMMGHDVACLDTHNLKALGIKDVRSMDVVEYIKLCQATGGTKFWWDKWCHHIATLYPKYFVDGDRVSSFHVECILDTYKKHG